MIHKLQIEFTSLLSQAKAQCSLDFQGLRVSNPEVADGVYDDFLITEDNNHEIFGKLTLTATLLAERLSAYFCEDNLSPSAVEYVIKMENPRGNCQKLQFYIENYCVYNLLEWWYSNRNEGLCARNSALAEAMLMKIRSQLESSTCERRLNIF